MEHARLTSSDAIGLLLDQEKAYNRAHPSYVRHVFIYFDFPESIVDSLSNLFFTIGLQINIIDFLSTPVVQRRGLRQRDSVSPVLFNLSFEPFQGRVLSDPRFPGFQLPRTVYSPPSLDAISSVKLMAYVNDVVCFLNNPLELSILQQHLNTSPRLPIQSLISKTWKHHPCLAHIPTTTVYKKR